MFTQCSKCETVFRLSAEVLRAAGGQVRCGRCGEVFNALSRLAEDATAFIKGVSPLELETRAAEILEATDALEAVNLASEPAEEAAPLSDAPPGMEVAQLQILDPPDDAFAETSLEFTLPPGELDRVFIGTSSGTLQQLAVEGFRGEHSHAERISEGPTSEHLPIGHDGEQISAEASEQSLTELSSAELSSAEHSPVEHSTVEHSAAERTSAEQSPVEQSSVAQPPDQQTPTAPAATLVPLPGAPLTRIAGLEVSEDVRHEMLASYAHAELPEIGVRRRQLPFAAWVGAAIVLGILLVAQIVHGNGDWLAAHTPLLRGLSTPAANLSAYQLRQWGVTGDPGAKGTLRVRASIMNTAAQLQPYPLLRVTLANRFGTRVGGREFEPAEYLGHAVARMLAPGERADATLDILDPGKDAEGFEIDVCVRGTAQKMLCAGEAQAK